MDIRKSPVHHVTSSVNGCSLGLIGTWMFANASRIFVWWRRHRSRALTAPQERSCYLLPGSAENGTQGLSALPLALPCPFSSFRYYHKCVCRVRCVDALTAQYGPTAQWESSLPPWRYGPQWNLTFPASFLVSIWFDSGEINMLSSLIPSNKSPCHHFFPMLL